MCGRYTLRRISLVSAAMQAAPLLPFDEYTDRPRFNVAPSQGVPIVRMEHSARVIDVARWGLIPRWAAETPKIRPINARAWQS